MNGSHETLREDSDSGPEGPNEAGRYVQANTRLYRSSEWNDANIKNIVVPGAQAGEGIGGRRPVEIDAGHGRFVGWNVDVAWSARLAGDWTWDLLNRDGESSPHSEANSFEEVQIPPLFAQVISDPDAETAAMLERAKAIMRMRKARVELLGGAMLGEPGFDLLLALYVLSAKQDSFSMTVLANAAGVPSASAWRWLAYLGDKGFITRCQSTSDRRAISIRLTEAGRKVFNEFLAFR